MKVLILDDNRDIVIAEVREALSKKKIDAVVCNSSNELLTALNDSRFDAAYINAKTWAKGRAMYDYFDAGSRLTMTLIYYNVPETMVPIKNRRAIDGDIVYHEPFDLKAVIETL